MRGSDGENPFAYGNRRQGGGVAHAMGGGGDKRTRGEREKGGCIYAQDDKAAGFYVKCFGRRSRTAGKGDFFTTLVMPIEGEVG